MAESFYVDGDLSGAASNFDASDVSLGFGFTVAVAGTATHGRFRSHATLSGGTYQLALYQVTAGDPPGGGTSLGSVTVGAFGGAEWVTAAFSSPIALTPGVLYKAVLRTSVGRYLSIANMFVAAAITRGNITAVRDNVTTAGFQIRNGSFRYASGLTYPFEGAGGAYLVDVVFEPDAAETVEVTLTGSVPAPAGALSVDLAVVAALAGDVPAPTGALALDLTVTATLAGSVPAPGGAVEVTLAAAATLAGSVPAPGGALVVQVGDLTRGPRAVRVDGQQQRVQVISQASRVSA